MEQETEKIYNVFGGQLTEGDIIDGINEDAFYYWDIIDVIRENENIRNLVFRKLIALNPYSEEYKDFKGILDEINDIRWKQQEEYDEMRQDEAKRKEEEERKKREAEYQQEEYYEGYEEQTPQEQQYEGYLLAIERCEQKIAEYEELLEDESLDDQERDNYESLISSEQADIDYYTEKARKLEYQIKMAELGTSLTTMTPQEIEQEYIKLLEEKEYYRSMQEDDGIDVADEALDLNNNMIELIEGFAQSSPEIQALLQAQKEKYAKMAEKREEFEYSEEEIEALAEREAKSKEARDAGFEINEYEEIIRPAREETPRPLEDMSIEELQSAVQQNNKTIQENDKTIKQALIKRLLGQQKIIAGQEAEIARLSNQKEL